MKYTIVKTEYYSLIEDQVNKLIKQGWVPQGGLATLSTVNSYYYLQAMVKHDLQ